jgi:Rps23 Pro-64 3,4-dihydroxylase Tpa1-like proline 4-hydroxylase
MIIESLDYYDPEIMIEKNISDSFSSLCFGYKNIFKLNYDETLISYYENGGYYKKHDDQALYSAITWFYKEPKRFSGGNFYFNDYEIEIKIKNNMTVIFPSFIQHSVDKVTLEEDSSDKLSGLGRYSMTQFLYINKLIRTDAHNESYQ